MRLGAEHLEAALLGGAFLGGGGGGSMVIGRALGEAALAAGSPELLPLDALDGGALVATVALVGAPASRQAEVLPADAVRACGLLLEMAPMPLCGLITCENGGTATVNGWVQAVRLGLPVIDAPADGRAHPTGEMGGLNVDRIAGYESIQAACGGSRARGRYLERQVRGSVVDANRAIREAAASAGGLVAVARNPVAASHLAGHAAVGAITQAIDLGRLLRPAVGRGADAVAAVAEASLDARLAGRGPVRELTLRSRGGFDTGVARVGNLLLTIWNEYMTLERDGERVATFPDLIVTLDDRTGMPVTSAELIAGMPVAVVVAPASALRLGAAVRDPAHLKVIERVIGRRVLPLGSSAC